MLLSTELVAEPLAALAHNALLAIPESPITLLARVAKDGSHDALAQLITHYMPATSAGNALTTCNLQRVRVLLSLLLDSAPPPGLHVDSRVLEHEVCDRFHMLRGSVSVHRCPDRGQPRAVRGLCLNPDDVPNPRMNVLRMLNHKCKSSVHSQGRCTYTDFTRLPPVLFIGIEWNLNSGKMVVIDEHGLDANAVVFKRVDDEGLAEYFSDEPVGPFDYKLVSWVERSSRGDYHLRLASEMHGHKAWRKYACTLKQSSTRVEFLCYELKNFLCQLFRRISPV